MANIPGGAPPMLPPEHLSETIQHKALLQQTVALELLPPTTEANRAIRHDRALQGSESVQTILSQKEALERAKIDPLTGMKNRSAFEDDYPRIFERASSGKFALIYVDVANLKTANDEFSHEVGDTYLQAVAAGAKKASRPTDSWYRIGGDEIVGLLEGGSTDTNKPFREDIRDLVQRMKEETANEVRLAELPKNLFTGIGVGVAIKHDKDTAKDLLRIADVAMETDKQELYKSQGQTRRSK